jgi:hypothetical protein
MVSVNVSDRFLHIGDDRWCPITNFRIDVGYEGITTRELLLKDTILRRYNISSSGIFSIIYFDAYYYHCELYVSVFNSLIWSQ